MNRSILKITAVVILAIVLTVPATVLASGNIPKTPIAKVLSYKNGLQLSESQIKKLTHLENSIIDKMIQVKGQADIRKREIDDFTSNWSNINGVATKRLINEYYEYLAKFKELELEAIMKARAVLTRQQIKKFTELASIETMIIKLEQDLSMQF